MSLDVDLMVTMPTSVYSANITHNLGAMAKEVKYGVNVLQTDQPGEELTLYHILWRPEDIGMIYAKDIVNLLEVGWRILISNPDKYNMYNPPNGWGNYQGLVSFVYHYYNACKDNPEAELRVSR